ncbi:hypothetical protein F3Y22_tig00011662pilonHSYRG00031 [Hibiscus syriacus]|uniref:EF-hand domain-containing protein n=1 Tax=Hibiscus syriacus TaxID=106335 RepID=A0A6A3C7Q6_HIBSY|nr:hypothetical protein F3Y22_tig00011662pilonHSYRG00031 [Hibiscus syriacus]
MMVTSVFTFCDKCYPKLVNYTGFSLHRSSQLRFVPPFMADVVQQLFANLHFTDDETVDQDAFVRVFRTIWGTGRVQDITALDANTFLLKLISCGRRSPCLPGDLLGRHVFPVRGHPTEAIREHPRLSESIRKPSELAMRGHPRATERAMRGNPREAEGRSPGVHGDLQGRQEGLATKGRSPGVHGDLQGHPECMATYGQHCGFHPI